MPQSHASDNSLTTTKAGIENSSVVVEISGTSTEDAVMVTGGREDLTTFFSIGVVIDALLLTAFLIWAVGQWRKTKK